MKTELARPLRGPGVGRRPDAAPRVSKTGWYVVAGIVLCVFEGALRKWAFQGSSPAFQAVMLFSKDVPLGLAMMSCLSRPAGGGIMRPLHQLLVAGGLMFALGTLGAADGFAPTGAIMSVRNAVVMPWLAYFVCRGLNWRTDLPLILHVIGGCAVVNAVIGGGQFFAAPDHWLNAQVNEGQDVIGNQGRVRANGTFAFLNGMGDMCVVTTWAAGILIGARPLGWAGYVYAVAGFTCAAEAMSRSGLFTGIFMLAATVVLQPRTRFLLPLLALVGGLTVLMPGAGAEVESEGNDPGIASAVFRRHTGGNESLEGRVLNSFLGDLPDAVENFPTGTGLGRGQSGQAAAAAKAGLLTTAVFESEPSRVVYEIGVVGLLGVAVVRVGVPVLLWQYLPPMAVLGHGLGGAIWIPTILLLAMGNIMLIVFNHCQATFQAVALMCLLSVARGVTASRRVGATA